MYFIVRDMAVSSFHLYQPSFVEMLSDQEIKSVVVRLSGS